MTRRGILAVIAVLAVASACGREEAKEKAAALAEKAKHIPAAAREAVPGAITLSETSRSLLQKGAQAVPAGIERAIVEGHPVAATTLEIARRLKEKVHGETVIEPIYQPVGDAEAKARTEKAIGDMPRTEVIDGLTIGFKDLKSVDTSRHVTERGYLVIWREGDHLVGFVYRTRREIDIDGLVREAPEIVRLVREASRAAG